MGTTPACTMRCIAKSCASFDVPPDAPYALMHKHINEMPVPVHVIRPELPQTINEAIEIARRYSTEKSDKFVNGVLDSILDDLKKSGKLRKTGRGLLETAGRKNPST